MTGGVLTFGVLRHEIVAPGAGWVYAWRETGAGARAVIYVGATWLHPVARAEKHLRDPDPQLGRIRTRYPAKGGDLAHPMTVHAVEIGPDGRRAVVKARVAWLAHQAGLISPRYCGEPPAEVTVALTPAEEESARALVAALG